MADTWRKESEMVEAIEYPPDAPGWYVIPRMPRRGVPPDGNIYDEKHCRVAYVVDVNVAEQIVREHNAYAGLVETVERLRNKETNNDC